MKKKTENQIIETLVNLFNVSSRDVQKATHETQMSVMFGQYHEVNYRKPDKIKVIVPLAGEVEITKTRIGKYLFLGKPYMLTEIAEYYDFVPLDNVE